jgi:hypothetical protein
LCSRIQHHVRAVSSPPRWRIAAAAAMRRRSAAVRWRRSKQRGCGRTWRSTPRSWRRRRARLRLPWCTRRVAVSPARSASQPPNRSCSTNGNCTSLTAAVCSRTAASGQPASLPPLTAFPVSRASPSSLICDQISCRTSGSDRFPSMRWPALAITPSIISTRSGSTPRSNLILAAPSLVKPSAMMSRRISEVPSRRVNPGRLRQPTIQHVQDRRGHGRP